MHFVCTLLLAVFINSSYQENLNRPNVVFIIADDLGWDDVSFHGSNQILTPNIDMLAYTGVPLERYYSHSICTPSRTALLTSKFAHVLGMQGYPITNGEDRAIPLTEKLLPQYFKDLGYATHLVGKWHVGHARSAYLPTFRGFDTHFGHRGGYIDYYEYLISETWGQDQVSGFDLFRNMTPAWDVSGYLTELYTNEAKNIIKQHDTSKPLFLMLSHNAPHSANEAALLQAPPEQVRAQRHVESPQRRIYAAMVKMLDDSIGEVIEQLQLKNILDNTIIIFVSDNGGKTSGSNLNYGSNYPMRGMKMSPFEGGIRVNGLIWSRKLIENSHVWNGFIHVVDWLPTLMTAVNASIPKNIDGVDMWKNIITNSESKRNVCFEIDDYEGYSAIIYNDYKLITGTITISNSIHAGKDLKGMIGRAPSYSDALKRSIVYKILKSKGTTFNIDNVRKNTVKISCNTDTKEDLCYPGIETLCLFNIKDDPCETKDLSAIHPDIVEELYGLLIAESKRIIYRKNPIFRDPKALPSIHNHTWTTWLDNIDVESSKI